MRLFPLLLRLALVLERSGAFEGVTGFQTQQTGVKRLLFFHPSIRNAPRYIVSIGAGKGCGVGELDIRVLTRALCTLFALDVDTSHEAVDTTVKIFRLWRTSREIWQNVWAWGGTTAKNKGGLQHKELHILNIHISSCGKRMLCKDR